MLVGYFEQFKQINGNWDDNGQRAVVFGLETCTTKLLVRFVTEKAKKSKMKTNGQKKFKFDWNPSPEFYAVYEQTSGKSF